MYRRHPDPAWDSTLLNIYLPAFRAPVTDSDDSLVREPAPVPNLIYYSFPPFKVPVTNTSINFWLNNLLFNAIGTGVIHRRLLEPAPAPVLLHYSLPSFKALVAVSGRSQPLEPAPASILLYYSFSSSKVPELALKDSRHLDLVTDPFLFSYYLLLSNVQDSSNKNNFSALTTVICRLPEICPVFNRIKYYVLSIMGPVTVLIYNRYLGPATDTIMFVCSPLPFKVPHTSKIILSTISAYACRFPDLIPLTIRNNYFDLFVFEKTNCIFFFTILDDD